VKLHAVNKEEPTKDFVGGKRKTTEKESKKHHPITARGLGDAFGTGEDDLLPSDEEPLPLSLGQIGFFEFRGNPAGRRVPPLLLRHFFLVRNSLNGHPGGGALGGCEEAEERKEGAAMVAVEEQRIGKQ
jgi:hypothetical protein